MRYQATIKQQIVFEGIGVHSGLYEKIILCPADADSGIVFVSAKNQNAYIKIGLVIPLPALHATIIEANGLRISTVEHLLSALYVLGITNVRVIVEGDEVPILDGSAYPFIVALEKNITIQNVSCLIISPKRPLIFSDEQGRSIEINPRINKQQGLFIDYEADFSHPQIKKQHYAFEVSYNEFKSFVAPARTFGFLDQLPYLRKHNLGLGTSLGNSLVYDDEYALNQERFLDECVRHKVLDFIGDIALCGAFLDADIKASKTSHNFNRNIVADVIQKQDNWQYSKG